MQLHCRTAPAPTMPDGAGQGGAGRGGAGRGKLAGLHHGGGRFFGPPEISGIIIVSFEAEILWFKKRGYSSAKPKRDYTSSISIKNGAIRRTYSDSESTALFKSVSDWPQSSVPSAAGRPGCITRPDSNSASSGPVGKSGAEPESRAGPSRAPVPRRQPDPKPHL